MSETKTAWRNIVRRSDRGLCVAGTRITLYLLMDYLEDDWPPHLVRDWFGLTDEQMQDVLDYIEANRAEFEAEYRQVIEDAAIRERYWRRLNKEHFEKVAQGPPPPGKEEAWAKLQARKQELGVLPSSYGQTSKQGDGQEDARNGTQHIVVRRSDRGLSIMGTRITLYTIMEDLKAGWSLHQIRDGYGLTDEQVQGALDYIEANREEFEREYQEWLEEADIVEQYWRAYNRERMEKVAQLPPPPGREAVWAKLQEEKRRWRSE